MGSSPTPGALVVDSYRHFINLKRQDNIDNLQKADQPQCTLFDSREKTMKELITSICKYQKPFIRKSLDKVLENSIENIEIICKYIITPSNSCADISDIVDLSSEQIDAEEVRIIAFFDNCDLDSASLQLNLVQNDDLKLVAANLDDGLSDAVEVEMNQVVQSQSSSNILYEATITDSQEGQDLDTGETKTLNNVNGIVLWNDDGDEPIEFANNNFVEADINFFN